MSIGGDLDIGSEVLEVRRVRWRYVKGGLRMVTLLCAAKALVPNSAACDTIACADSDAIAGARVVRKPYLKVGTLEVLDGILSWGHQGIDHMH